MFFHIVMMGTRKKKTMLLLDKRSSKNIIRFSDVILLLYIKMNKQVEFL